MSILIKKNIQNGGEVNNTNKAKIKNIIRSDESRLVFCDLRTPRVALGIENFNRGIPIIIIKKKNRINNPSNYYAIHQIDTNFQILAQGIGKEAFYNDLNSLKDKKNSNSVLATKILIFFKIDWIIFRDPHLSEEFYDLNKYFMSRIP